MSCFTARERLRRQCTIHFTNFDFLESESAVNGWISADANEHSLFLFKAKRVWLFFVLLLQTSEPTSKVASTLYRHNNRYESK